MKTPRAALLGLALSVPLAFSLLASVSAQSYTFTNFDASGQGLLTTVNGISNSGVVVGSYTDGITTTNFSGTPGSFTPLNLSSTASANGINSSLQVVGSDGNGGSFLLNSAQPGNTPLPLPFVDSFTTSEAAFGISDNGVIVGQYSDDGGVTSSGFVDTLGIFTTIDPTGTPVSTSAQGINNNGLVVGFYGQAGNPAQTSGFLYDTTTGVTTQLADPTDPSGASLAFTQFLGINNSGEAVGYYQTTGTGTLPAVQHGFLYNTNTNAYTFLDDPNVAPGGSATMQITGITNSGEIAGFYTDAGGAQFGFIASPAAVPEASSLVSLSLLMALGLGGVCAAKRRTLTRH